MASTVQRRMRTVAKLVGAALLCASAALVGGCGSSGADDSNDAGGTSDAADSSADNGSGATASSHRAGPSAPNSAAAGGGIGALAGTWTGTDSTGNHDTLQIFDDGTASIASSNAVTCQGHLDTHSNPERLAFDCGTAKGVATVKLGDDGNLQLTLAGAETEIFTKAGG